MKSLIQLLLLVAVCFLSSNLHAQNPAADPAARLVEARQLADKLNLRQGDIILGDGLAKVTLPDNFRYLDPADTQTVLSKIWRNPVGPQKLGMIVPADFDPLSSDSWVVVISYEGDGYVKDTDAAKIDYTQMMTEMKESVADASKEREKKGYSSIELIGWAAPPRYDPATHKLYWAKEIKFGQSSEHTLNYNIRILGRQGVLVLNAIAGMDQLGDVEAATPTILQMVNFEPGHRYTDFKQDTDKVATYGIAALIVGGVAAKAGLFKLLWVGILALKKFIIIGVAAIAGFLKRFFQKRKAKASPFTAPTTPSETPPGGA